MAKAKDVNWTRELLERAVNAEGDEVWALAEELGITRGTIYSRRKMVLDQGYEAALGRSRRHRKPRPEQTLMDELSKNYTLYNARGGRGDTVQYSVTIPKRMGELFVERFGRTVRFVPVEDGLKIEPLERFTPDDLPSWIPPEAVREADEAGD